MIQIYIYPFSYSFPWWFITGYWIYFPVLYGRTLLLIHPKCSSLHLLTPNSQSFLLHPHPLATTSLSPWPWFSFCFLGRFVCHILDSTWKWYPMVFGENTCWYVAPLAGGSPGPQEPRGMWGVHGLREDWTLPDPSWPETVLYSVSLTTVLVYLPQCLLPPD